jgi:hypothetical protein
VRVKDGRDYQDHFRLCPFSVPKFDTRNRFNLLLANIGTVIANLFPESAETLASLFPELAVTLAHGINLFPELVQTLASLFPESAETLASRFPELAETLASLFPELAETLAPAINVCPSRRKLVLTPFRSLSP